MLIDITMDTEEAFKTKLMECLTQQLSEIELLTSMYPNSDDIVFTDSQVFNDVQNFLDHKTPYMPNHLDLTINLHIDDLKLETSFNLPSFYPEEEPDIFVRCNQLNRQQETTLNSDLSNYIKSNCLGEQCLYTVTTWLHENIEKYNTKSLESNKNAVECKSKVAEKFSRLWIYSHHIYNKKKREEIVKMAREYNLTGFSLPGKPGIICIEGAESDTSEWWKLIKGLNWKKIVIRKIETFEECETSKKQKFTNFEELHFGSSSRMSKFSKFIEDLGLSHVFNDFFGLCIDET